jgi:cell division septal protein FtsQ
LAKKKQPAKKQADRERQAEKRARREARKIAEAKAAEVAARKRRIRIGLSVVAAAAVVGTLGFIIVSKAIPDELPGVSQPSNEGRDHVVSGQQVGYATATPTSGRHAATSPGCGIYGQQMPAEFAVHALEHGAVVIWYQASMATDEVASLRAVVNRFDDRVILSPNAELSEPVVATGWNRLKAYDDADPELEQFIETYRSRGPESFSCPY